MTQLDMENSMSSIVFDGGDMVSGAKPDWWTDDGIKGTWQDTYTARRRVFPDGQCEVTVCKERFFLGPGMTPQTRAKRGESENREASDEASARRARKTVRHRCKAIGADRLVTLTYRKNMMDRAAALKDFDRFRRRLGKVKAFHYVAVIEQQERGAIHFHIAVHGRQNYALLRSIWQSVLGKGENGEQLGQCNVRDPHKFGFGSKGQHKLASYIAKYCGKQMDVRDINEKRYFCSRGIVVPDVETWRLPGVNNMLDAAKAAFNAITGHSMNGLQTWCFNGLGVVYLATEPGLVDIADLCPF